MCAWILSSQAGGYLPKHAAWVAEAINNIGSSEGKDDKNAAAAMDPKQEEWLSEEGQPQKGKEYINDNQHTSPTSANIGPTISSPFCDPFRPLRAPWCSA